MEVKVVIPYSQHHREYAMLVGSVANQAVFETLMDEYLVRIKTNKPISDIPYQINRIARSRNLSWRTVKNSMDSLTTMRLITFDQNYYTIDGDMYMSLIIAFSKLKFIEKEQFASFLSEGRFDELEKFGFEFIENSAAEILNMKGSLGSLDAKPMQNVRTLLKMSEVSEKCQNPLKNVRGFLKMSEGSDIFNNFVQNFTEKTCDLGINLLKMSEPSDIFNTHTGMVLEKILSRDVVLNRISDILQRFGQNVDEEVVNLCFFAEISYDILQNPLKNIRTLLKISEPSDIFNNRNKIKENKKEKSENEVFLLKEKNKETFYEQDELDFNIPEQDEDNDEPLSFQIDDNMMGGALNKYQLYKKKKRLPYLPASTVMEFASDIRNCLDRADKIFINQVWNILHEMFDQDCYEDEDGNTIPSSDDVENSCVIKERLEKDILMPALEQTLSIIENGKVAVNGEELTVTAQEIPEEYYNLIIDWEVKAMVDGESYIVSASRLRNIYADQVNDSASNVKTRRGNDDGRDDDYSYMRKIISIGSDDELYSQLTPIELAVYNFILDNFQLDEQNEIVEPNSNFLPEKQLRIFIAEIKQNGISQSEFVGVIFNNKLSDGGVSLRNRMFSASKIRNWNAIHNSQSIVDDYNISAPADS